MSLDIGGAMSLIFDHILLFGLVTCSTVPVDTVLLSLILALLLSRCLGLSIIAPDLSDEATGVVMILSLLLCCQSL